MPITKESFTFMAELWENNNKGWFDRNRERYVAYIREPVKELAASLSGPVSMIMPDFNGKPKISKINADIRFHPKKKPYKEHIWISFFESGVGPIELFVYLGRRGWGAGAGITSMEKGVMDRWRANLIGHTELWRKYARAIGVGKRVLAYKQSPYSKPLFPDIPADIYDLVQSRSLWIVEKENKRKQKPTDADFFEGLCRLLPCYIFMTTSPENLRAELKRLGRSIKAPEPGIEKIWKAIA